ncbi:MAG: endonuclease VII domain-containing protein [Nanoarchaeota archaeon]
MKEKAKHNKEWHQKYYIKNKDKIKKYQLENRDKTRKNGKTYRERYKEKIKISNENYRQKHREEIRENSKKYRQNNKEKYNTEYYRKRDLKKKYGIDIIKYNEISKKQKNVCAICVNSEKDKDYKTKIIRQLAVDHNHETGKVRGLLCSKCNKALGLFKDNIEILEKAIKYLKLYE